MVLKISGLSDGDNFFDFRGKIEEIGLNNPFYENYFLSLKLTKSHSQLLLKADLSFEAKFNCDRCDIEFLAKINTNFVHCYFFGKVNLDDQNPNVTYLPTDADKIDISEQLYDFSTLSVPMKKLCKDDCKGLCSKCGKNLNFEKCDCSFEEIDDRWLPLLELKEKNK